MEAPKVNFAGLRSLERCMDNGASMLEPDSIFEIRNGLLVSFPRLQKGNKFIEESRIRLLCIVLGFFGGDFNAAG